MKSSLDVHEGIERWVIDTPAPHLHNTCLVSQTGDETTGRWVGLYNPGQSNMRIGKTPKTNCIASSY